MISTIQPTGLVQRTAPSTGARVCTGSASGLSCLTDTDWVGFPVGGGSQDDIVNVGGSDYTIISIKAGETQARVLGQTPRRN